MATLEEMLAELERRQGQQPAAAPPMDPAAAPPMDPAAPPAAAAPTAGAPSLDQLLAEQARRAQVAEAEEVAPEQPQFADDPSLTPERMAEMGEAMSTQSLLFGREPPAPSQEMEALGLGGVERALTPPLEHLSQAWLTMTTSDPEELAQILTSRFPDDIEVTRSPEGVLVATNKHTGFQAAINKPGFSPMDVMQTIGLIGAYLPQNKMVGAAKGILKRSLKGILGAGAVETGLQTGQAMAGGEFNESDIALSAVTGIAPEAIVKPVTKAITGAKEFVKPLGDFVPGTIKEALAYAKKHGLKITSSDALKEFVTFPMQLYLKIAERIPVTGTGGIATRQTAERAQALSRIAEKFDINVETEFGEEILDSFVRKMTKKRFWGKNKNPTPEQMAAAWKKESAEISDTLLNRYIRRGNIDEDLVDRALDSGKPKHIRALFGKLDERGQAAAKQRFIARGLEKSGWTPEGARAQIADPKKFMKYLDNPKNRKSMRAMFSDEEMELLAGTREYLRLTAPAGDIKGAGMTAAMAAGAGIYLLDMTGAAVAGASTGLSAQALQSAPMRNLFLRLAHAKGNEPLTAAIMERLRPLTLALGNQYMEGTNPIELDIEISEDMVKGSTDEAMEYLRSLGPKAEGAYEDITAYLQGMMQ